MTNAKSPAYSGSSDKVLQALGDPTRRAIFEKLRPGGGLSVADIAEGMPVSRPAVSQHVKVLQEARLIRVRKEGTRSICEIDPEGLLAMRTWLDQFWDSALMAFKQAAENSSHG
jgi:DNA-binding transcriptional ArsR family regulator